MLACATAPPSVSASTSRTSPPAAAASKARLTATVVRPGPPFGPQTAATIRRPSPSGWTGTSSCPGRTRASPDAGGSSAGPDSAASAACARSTNASGGSASKGDMQEPELAEASLAVLVAGRGQPGQRVPVQPAGPGRDNRHLGLTGGRHGEQVAEVVAPVQHLRPNLPRLAGLDQRLLPRR